MYDANIESPFDFSLVLERMIREYPVKLPARVLNIVEQFGQECFNEGFRAGKKPVNHPRYQIGNVV